MKEPQTYKELLDLVNPLDLLEVLDFSGINSNRDEKHSKARNIFASEIYKSLERKRFDGKIYLYEKEPLHQNTVFFDINYETIIKCIQDFYWWSHDFNHPYSHIYKRVVNALEIPMDEIKKIHEIKEGYDKK